MRLPPEFEPPAPYVPPPSEVPARTLVELQWSAPFHWLMLAWRDLVAYPGIAAFYGAAFCVMAVALQQVFEQQPEYTMSMACGCLLLGPFLAMGLYEVSRRRELALPVSLRASALCWHANRKSMGLLLLVLMVLELLWGRASLVVVAVCFNTGMPSTVGVIAAIFSPDNWDFVLIYTLVGGAFAALVYSLTVVAIPMILDRDTDAISACITSMAVVMANAGVMMLWGALIVVLVTVSLWLPVHAGLLLAGPMLGHASWHAYRATVASTQDGTVP